MQTPFKLVAGSLLAGVLIGFQPAMAQPKAREKSPAKPVAARADGRDAAETKRKAGAATAKPASEPKPAVSAHTTEVPRLSPEEAQHKARYDAATAAIRERALSSEDAGRIREAVAAIGDGGYSRGKALRDQISDPAGRKLIDWYLYRNGYGTAGEIRAFVAANPAWPDRTLLTRRAEENLFESNAGPAEVRAFFAQQPPATAVGLAALAAALAADKSEADAKALAAKLWVEYDIPASYEAEILKRIGGLLTEADRKRRLDRLLLNDSRWASERKERAATIRRVIARLSEPEKKKAEARLAVYLRAKNSSQLMAKLPAEALANEWGLAFQRAQALRRQNKDEEAWKILLSEPEPTLAVRPDGWWEERRANAYAALRAGNPKMAYELVRDPGPLLVNSHNDASFMAGWLALRHLNNPKQALVHFQALARSADGPLSRARAHYWLGRTYEALGDRGKANESYLAASLQIDTFHGQLARLKLDPHASALKIDPPAPPTPEEIARFNSLDAIQAAMIAHKAGLDHSVVRAFLIQLRTHMKTEAEVAMLAHLAEALGDTQSAVRVGKYGIAQGFNLIYYAYPVHRLPAYTPLRRPPETALILGIARQESEFNMATLSGAGARGILQVMPVTARHVCRDYKLKCDIPRLMKDPAYNTMMGSAYISDRMDEFGGSYILAIAGYNAGPGRAREWIREFGDPRDPRVDPIDWIHRIPIQETREYVQKVLSNIQIYRARLGEEATAVRIDADLRRASAPEPKGTAGTKGTAAASADK
ncbi:MAG TPA: lytic transglycosylase domain-containing protein [Hyphomicrobiaceae bacterium]